MWSRRWRVVVGCVSVVLLAAGALVAAPWPQHAGMADSSVVYCLFADRRPQLRDAAVVLGLGSPAPSSATGLVVSDTPVDLDRWRGQHPRDCEKACSALMAAVGGPGQPGAGGGGTLTELVGNLGPVTSALVDDRLAQLRDLSGSVERLALAYSRSGRWHPDMRTAITVRNDHAG
jgi:hypothetical protein